MIVWRYAVALCLLLGLLPPAMATHVFCIGGSCTDQAATVPETCEAARVRLGGTDVSIAASGTLGLYCAVQTGGGFSNQPVRLVSAPGVKYTLSEYLAYVTSVTVIESGQTLELVAIRDVAVYGSLFIAFALGFRQGRAGI